MTLATGLNSSDERRCTWWRMDSTQPHLAVADLVLSTYRDCRAPCQPGGLDVATDNDILPDRRSARATRK
jgi:hypothetical protein